MTTEVRPTPIAMQILRILWVQGSTHGYVPPEYEGRDFVREEP